MAYPPTIPPATRTNNTPQVDDHPDDHNAIANALTDIVNALGSDPAGDAASLTAYLAILDPIRVMQSPVAVAPTGWLLCDGSSVAAATYPRLFAAIAYTYGGAGANFNLPDYTGKVLVTLDSGDTDFDSLTDTGGAKTHTLVESELPSHEHAAGAHTHGVTGTATASGVGFDIVRRYASYGTALYSIPFDADADGNTPGGDTGGLAAANGGDGSHTHPVTGTAAAGSGNTGTIGSDGAHNNLQPYAVINTFIRAA
jgi:microcystin-dependent protein